MTSESTSDAFEFALPGGGTYHCSKLDKNWARKLHAQLEEKLYREKNSWLTTCVYRDVTYFVWHFRRDCDAIIQKMAGHKSSSAYSQTGTDWVEIMSIEQANELFPQRSQRH